MNDSIKSKTDRVVGTVKESIGKALDSEQMELDGKLQKLAGGARERAAQISEDAKETIAEKANDLIDLVKKKNE